MRLGRVHGDSEISDVILERLPPFSGRDPSFTWNFIAQRILNYCQSIRLDEQAPIILAFPGPVLDGRSIASAPTIVGVAEFDDVMFVERLESLTCRRVLLLNDVSAAAWFFSRYDTSDTGIVVTVSSGIGAKVFNRRAARWVDDSNPFAGEIGHVVIDESDSAPLCDCGMRGHLSAVSSGRAAERSARKIALSDPASFKSSLIFKGFGIDANAIENELHLVPAALAKDSWACAIIQSGIVALASSLAMIVTAQGLKSIIIMGGFATALGSYYIDALQNRIDQLTKGMLSNSVSVTSATSFTHDWPTLRGCGIYGSMTGI